MNSEVSYETPKRPDQAGIDYFTMSFLILTPLLGVAGTAVYTILYGFSLWMPVLAAVMYGLVGLSICAGYHRFFSHKSYEASRAVQIFFAVFGAMAAQNSILWWSSSHRIHHQYVDRDWDPYSIRRGFWWAHILWVFHRHDAPPVETNAADLLNNPVVRWQARWYKAILIVGGFGLPALVGAAFGDPIAGLLWGGFLRLAVVHHTTFFVNSLAHSLGKPTYNADVSARDNWAVALLTLGEGYHSFHHRFPADFRNGIRRFDWDPAKWFIATLGLVGLASDLRATPPPQVAQARMRRLVEDAKVHLASALTLWRQHIAERSSNASMAWRQTRRRARHHVREARRRWLEAGTTSLASSHSTVR